jgi:ribosomal protein S12 methylthiotransferase
MQLQADISRTRLQAKVGSVQQVLVDAVDENGAIARSYADAPEIDGQVYVLDGQHLEAGDLVDVKIADADEYDLSGHLCG